MLTDTVSSSFVPIGMNSPHPSQSVCSDDHTEQDKGFGRPLAHGRIFTTAPFGPAFREFAHGEHVDGSTPIVLKVCGASNFLQYDRQRSNLVFWLFL